MDGALLRDGPSLIRPVIQAVIPSSGPAAGGTGVTVYGYGLTGANAANFLQPGFTVVSDIKITGATAPGSGIVAATIANPLYVSAPLSDAFTYSGSPPPAGLAVTSNFPRVGSKAKPTHINVVGEGFLLSTTLPIPSINGNACTGIFVIDDENISCFTPPATAGSASYAITVATSLGTASGGSFKYYDLTDEPTCILSGEFNTTSGLTLNGSNVASMVDQSGHGHTMSESTSANQPPIVVQDQRYSGENTIQLPTNGAGIGRVSLSNTTIPMVPPYTVVICGQGADNGGAWWGAGLGPLTYLQFASNPADSEPAVVLKDTNGGVDLAADCYRINAPVLIMAEVSHPTAKIYVQNMTTPVASGPQGNLSTAGFCIGDLFSGVAAGLDAGVIKEFAVFTGTLSDASKANIQEYFHGRIEVAQPAPDTTIYSVGNSIAEGFNATAQSETDYNDLMAAAAPTGMRVIKAGSPGSATPTLQNAQDVLSVMNLSANQLSFQMEGVNHIRTDNVDGTTAYNALIAWLQNAKNGGILKNATATIMACSNGWTPTNETARLLCNSLLLQGATPIVAPGVRRWYQMPNGFYVCDVQSNPNLLDSTNRTVFYDGIHLTDLGHSYYAGDVWPGLLWIAKNG